MRKTVVITGLIGSGKSAVCALLRLRGVPVYDSDARTKRLYDRLPGLVDTLEVALGVPLKTPEGRLDRSRLAACIFSNPSARETLEEIVYPLVQKDFRRWRSRQKGARFVVVESAVILSKPIFDGTYDAVVLVTAPEQLRLQRVMARDKCSEAQARARMASQQIPMEKVDVQLPNDGTPQALAAEVERVFFHENSYLCQIINCI